MKDINSFRIVAQLQKPKSKFRLGFVQSHNRLGTLKVYGIVFVSQIVQIEFQIEEYSESFDWPTVAEMASSDEPVRQKTPPIKNHSK